MILTHIDTIVVSYEQIFITVATSKHFASLNHLTADQELTQIQTKPQATLDYSSLVLQLGACRCLYVTKMSKLSNFESTKLITIISPTFHYKGPFSGAQC